MPEYYSFVKVVNVYVHVVIDDHRRLEYYFTLDET